MSKSVKDYTSFAAKANSEPGISRQNARLHVPKILRLLLVCSLCLVLSPVSFAQVPTQPPDWGLGWWDFANNPLPGFWTPVIGGTGAGQVPFPANFGQNGGPHIYLYVNSNDNVAAGDRYTAGSLTGGLALTGSVRGLQGGGTANHWWVGGSLNVSGSGRVYQLDQLTVSGTVSNSGRIDAINTINFLTTATNNAGGQIGGAAATLSIMYLNVSDTLTNNGPSTTAGRAQITNVYQINTGSLINHGLIQQTGGGWGTGYINVATDLVNGSNAALYGGVTRQRGDAEIAAQWTQNIAVGGNLYQYFDGSIHAWDGVIDVGGTFYNAGEVRIDRATGILVDGVWWDDLTSFYGWDISANNIFNDGRHWDQWTEGRFPLSAIGSATNTNGAWGMIADAVQLHTFDDLTSQGANAVINGSVMTHDGSFMHVGGNLYNLDRSSIFNYQEIIVHGNFENRGATLVGGNWFIHSYLQRDSESPDQHRQAGNINVGRNVINHSEYAYGGEVYGGLIASFDKFTVHGSLYNDANSTITGYYEHHGTEPLERGYTIVPVDPVTGNGVIYGRRANIKNGVMLEGDDYLDTATVLTVRGIFSDSLSGQPTFWGLYNEGHIREIDIINVGTTNENTVLWNALATATPRATLPTSNGQAWSEGPINPPSTITDIGVINAANLINSGTISNIDVAINVAYLLYNDTTGRLDGESTSHVEWDYENQLTHADQATGRPVIRNIVLETTRADLRVGQATVNNQYLPGANGVGIINYGIITNFDRVTSLGGLYNYGTISNVTSITVGTGVGTLVTGRVNMYNAGILSNVDSVNASGDLTLASGSSFFSVGTITAYNDVVVNGTVDGGFSVLAAKTGKLIVNGSLGIDRGSIASGSEVENFGTITIDGALNSASTVLNEGLITNNGVISSYNDVINWGVITGNGMVSITRPGSQFRNELFGTITGGLAVHGNFYNTGDIVLSNQNDLIRITGGVATINGGVADLTYSGAVVGGQYLFLETDRPGDLVVLKELRGAGNGLPGSVLDIAPVYGGWNGTRYVPGELWHKNQYYWFEVARAYTYGNHADTANRLAVGNYIDKVGATVKQDPSYSGDYRNTGLWNLLAQLDSISESNSATRHHQGPINPEALWALDELSGAIYATVGTTTVHNVGVVNHTLANTLRSDVFKFSFIGNPNNAIRGQAIAPLRYNRWGTVFGIGGSSKHDGNAHGYEQTFGGIMAGIDRAFWTGTRIGTFLSVAGGDVSLKDMDERTKSVDAMMGLYLRQEMYYGYGLATAGYSRNTYKTTRNMTRLGHTAESRTHGNIGSVYLERGIDIPVYYATVQPFTSFQVVSVHLDEFEEKMRNQYGYNANIGLEGVKGRTDSFKLGLGARASSQPIPFPWGQLATSMNMAWYHEFNGEQDRDFITKFTNPGGSNFDAGLSDVTFRVCGNDPKRDWFNFGLGLHLDRNSTRFFVDANLFANERQTLFTANGGVVTSW